MVFHKYFHYMRWMESYMEWFRWCYVHKRHRKKIDYNKRQCAPADSGLKKE